MSDARIDDHHYRVNLLQWCDRARARAVRLCAIVHLPSPFVDRIASPRHDVMRIWVWSDVDVHADSLVLLWIYLPLQSSAYMAFKTAPAARRPKNDGKVKHQQPRASPRVYLPRGSPALDLY